MYKVYDKQRRRYAVRDESSRAAARRAKRELNRKAGVRAGSHKRFELRKAS